MTSLRQRFVRAALTLALAVLPTFAAAAPPAPAKSAASPTPSWLSQRGKVAAEVAPPARGWQSLAALGLVALLGGVALYLKRRRGERSSGPVAGLRVVSSARVGPRAHAVIVDVGGRRLLLGVSDASVSRLAWLDSRAAARAKPAPAATQERHDPKLAFSKIFSAALGEPGASEPASAALVGSEDIRDTFSSQGGRRVRNAPAEPEDPDIERQARGLLLRMREKRP